MNWLIRELAVWVGVGVSAGIAWLASWTLSMDFWHVFVVNVAAVAFGASFDIKD